MRTYQPSEFLQALKSKSLTETIAVSGMIKVDDANPDVVLFSPKNSCEDWITIPVSSLDRIDHLGTQKCDDHTHAKVTVHVRVPDSGESVAAFFAKILQRVVAGENNVKTRHNAEMQRARSGRLGAFVGIRGAAHCGNGQYIDCSVPCNYDDEDVAIREFEKEANYVCYNKGGLLSAKITEWVSCD